MKTSKLTIVALLLASSIGSSAFAAETNALLTPSPLPLQYPPFDKIADSDFGPAIEQGMAEHLREIQAITGNPDKPTFDNTILALERSGRLLGRAQGILFSLLGADSNPGRRKLQAELAPKLAAHSDAIRLDPKLFARIHALYLERNKLHLSPPAVRLIERYEEDYVRAGANLSDEQKARMREINGELAKLSTQFSQNVLAEVNDSAVIVDTREELAGLSEEQISAAAAAAKARGLEGKYLIALLNTTGQPVLAQLENRALRERIQKISMARDSRGNAYDNTAIVSRTLKLRAERAALLGYPNYAAFVLARETAKTPAAVNAMLDQVTPAAEAAARREGAVLQAQIDKEQAAKGQPSFKLEAWDWAFYTEHVRAAQYGYDESQIKPYLEMKTVLEQGVFYAAGQLYGLKFVQRHDLPVYQPDVLVYDVFDANGKQLAIFIGDYYARPSKRGGAWMNSYVNQNALEGTQPVVANHLNIPKPADGQPTLVTWDEVRTMFHEFGHALHGMFSNVAYPSFSGTSVPRDFVEFPSQVNEMWADWPSVLGHYAKHYKTGEPMPRELLDKVVAASKFNEGFATTEYMGPAVLDQRLHQLSQADIPGPEGVMDFEAKTLAATGFDYAPVPPRYRTPYFSHIMGGYAAGYYAYVWSQVLDADTVQWFKAHGGLTRANGDRFRKLLLSQGGSQDALALFTDMVGHGPEIGPLLERKGFAK